MRSAGVHGRSAGSPAPHRSLLLPYWKPACNLAASSWDGRGRDGGASPTPGRRDEARAPQGGRSGPPPTGSGRLPPPDTAGHDGGEVEGGRRAGGGGRRRARGHFGAAAAAGRRRRRRHGNTATAAGEDRRGGGGELGGAVAPRVARWEGARGLQGHIHEKRKFHS
jgi:hypothetical protein